MLDGGGSGQIARDEDDVLLPVLEPGGQLAAGGGLARAIESAKREAQRAVRGQFRRVAGKAGQQFVVDDFDELLAGADAGQHLRAETLFLHLVAKILGDLVIHIGGEQRQAHFPHGVGHIAFAELAVTAQRLEDALEFFLEKIEAHGSASLAAISASVILSLSKGKSKNCRRELPVTSSVPAASGGSFRAGLPAAPVC